MNRDRPIGAIAVNEVVVSVIRRQRQRFALCPPSLGEDNGRIGARAWNLSVINSRVARVEFILIQNSRAEAPHTGRIDDDRSGIPRVAKRIDPLKSIFRPGEEILPGARMKSLAKVYCVCTMTFINDEV